MIRYLTIAVTGLLVVAMSTTADAQIVRIGPWGGVSVRAPFVSVDTSPWGGARVRAPFTSVNTGVYGGYTPYYGVRHHYPYPSYVVPAPPVAVYRPGVTVVEPVPVYPPAYQSRSVPSQPPRPANLAQSLHGAAMALQRSLSMRPNDSDVWLKYLAPGRIVDVIEQTGNPASLRDLVANYNGVVGNRQLSSIRAAHGFAETRALLTQFVSQSPAAAAPTTSARPTIAEPFEQAPVPAPSDPVPAPNDPVTAPNDDRVGAPRTPLPAPKNVEPVERADGADAGKNNDDDVARREAPVPI